jgi:hypothetical protein
MPKAISESLDPAKTLVILRACDFSESWKMRLANKGLIGEKCA